MKRARDAQHEYWETYLSTHTAMFGEEPSYAAVKALRQFRNEKATCILELGAGQGRDTIFFAQNRLMVYALDYSESGLGAVAKKARKLGVANKIHLLHDDVRRPLPFKNAVFDGCYSHMLYNMALTSSELEALSEETRRVLKPNGLNIYTARNTHDPLYRQGISRGEDTYETGGFIVHFLSEEMVRRLARGYQVLSLEEFEEGKLPRRLYLVILKKTNDGGTREQLIPGRAGQPWTETLQGRTIAR